MTNRRDTGPAKLTGVSRPRVADSALQRWIDQISNWIETRSGSTGNSKERAVTERDLEEVRTALDALKQRNRQSQNGVPVEIAPGFTAVVPGDKFIDFIRSTQLYRDLLRKLDDSTRFDNFSSEIRSLVTRSIADEAAKRGASISQTETLISDTNRSFAAYMREVTAALSNNSAGIREVQASYVSTTEATATQITQLGSSLGNYYQDGTPGRANLESTLTTQANFTTGLRAQYTLKVSAGGALAGYGLAATEVDGTPSSAFIIQADKFAIVSPSYTGGLSNAPSNDTVPFGVDANGIYMNTNVYLKGSMRVDTGGKTLLEGLRGSVDAIYTAATWNDTTARDAIWTALGKVGTAPNNNHLVIGDSVTRTNGASPPTLETRYWNDTAWVAKGVLINGNLIVNGSLAATKIDTRNLDIRDAAGNVIFSSGVNLPASRVSGLGSLATQNSVDWNTQLVNIPGFGNFAFLSSITSANISTYIASAAIGTAYLANAAITEAKIGSLAVSRLKITSYPFTNGSASMSSGVTGDITITHNLNRNVLPVVLWNAPPSSRCSIYLTFSDANSFRFRMFDDSNFTGTVNYQYMYL